MSTTFPQIFQKVRQRPSHEQALGFRKEGTWQYLNWQEYYERAESVAGALRSLGLNKGDRVAILANTRWEWAVSDMGILGAGAVSVPIYPNNRAEDVAFVLRDSGSQVLILENKSQLNKWQQISSQCPNVRHVIVMESGAGIPESIIGFNDWLDEGREYSDTHPGHFAKSSAETKSEDPASIIYTSGTSGSPKGVLLVHRQIVSEITDVFSVLSIDSRDRSLSFLPYAHILGRVEMWGSVYTGFTLCFAESIDRISRNLTQIHPTILIAVPRIFEKIYGGILSNAEGNPLKNKVFHWALKVGRQLSHLRMNSRPVPFTLLPQYILAKKLVFDPLAEKLGGALRFAVSGGAPLSREIGEFFHAAGILLLEGYGLTETTAAVTVNTPFAYRFGTVGKPLPDVKVKIAEDGEILIKSDKVMKEYYNDEKATSEVMKDGYFATGDIGEITSDGFLRITDRKKDLIKTAGGKYVAPQRLENLLKLSPLISNVLIHGDQRKYIVALLTLNTEQAFELAKDLGLSELKYEELIQHPKIQEAVRKVVAEVNAQLASFETIKGFKILPRDFTVEEGELTPSLKVKRKFCDQKYSAAIESLYS